MLIFSFFFFSLYGDHRDLHVLTHSFPTRRSSDLAVDGAGAPLPVTYARSELFLQTEPGKVSWELAQVNHYNTRSWQDYIAKRSEEHTSELQSLMRISYAVFCLKKKNQQTNTKINNTQQYRHHRK